MGLMKTVTDLRSSDSLGCDFVLCLALKCVIFELKWSCKSYTWFCDFRVIRLENGLTALLISDVLQSDDDCMKKDNEGKQLILCMLLSADIHDTYPICTVHEECGTFNKNII